MVLNYSNLFFFQKEKGGFPPFSFNINTLTESKRGKIFRLASMLFLLLSLAYCGGSRQGEPLRKNVDLTSCFKTFLTAQDLENFGFEHLTNQHMSPPYFVHDSYYLANSGDKRIVKITGNKLVKSYQAAGQAGGEFMSTGQIFLNDTKTLAVFDPLKRSILLFDLDLNYISEKKIAKSFITQIVKLKENRYIVVNVLGDFVFNFIDEKFNIVENFIKKDRKIYYKKLGLMQSKQGMILNENTAACTIPLQPTRQCFVDIYDIPTMKKILVLKWKNSFPIPSQNDIENYKNIHAFGATFKLNEYYWIQNAFYCKKISLNANENVREVEELIFNDKGQLLLQQSKFPYSVIPSNDKNRVFAKDEDCNILVADISDIRKKLSNSNK